ncbi:hypothetical protein [Nocardia sp. SC052]|uniref:hypothetical protein n=1 Tax=Nocardia sichangensis TaxID=3385975 RepID=UPI0039A2ED5A
MSGRRKDTMGAECRVVFSAGERGGPHQIDVYCWQCWLDIGAPRTGDARICVVCGRVGTAQFRIAHIPETGPIEWRCTHTEKCAGRAYPQHGWNGPAPMCRFTRSGIHEPGAEPATHTVMVPALGWSMVCDGCAEYIRQHDTRSGAEVRRERNTHTEGSA